MRPVSSEREESLNTRMVSVIWVSSTMISSPMGGSAFSPGSMTALLRERSLPGPTPPSMSSGPCTVLVTWSWRGNFFSYSMPLSGSKSGSAATVRIAAIFQSAAVNVMAAIPSTGSMKNLVSVEETRVWSSGWILIVTSAVGALFSRTWYVSVTPPSDTSVLPSL